jgi:ABC-type hemin transport system ATPase subunit
MTPAAELRDVLVRRRLDVERLRFAPGRVTSVLGANGAGKSTLVRVLRIGDAELRGWAPPGWQPPAAVPFELAVAPRAGAAVTFGAQR